MNEAAAASEGLWYDRKSSEPEAQPFKTTGQWAVTVPDGDRTRVLAICADEETARLLITALNASIE